MNQTKNRFNRQNFLTLISLIVIILFVNLPVVQALEISNVFADNVATDSASVKWDTDLPADSFVSYGKDKENLMTTGDALPKTDHQINVKNLEPNVSYYFKVKSSDQVDDNNGELYSFMTLIPDTVPPEISVTVSEKVKGTELDISGTSEVGATISLYVNEALAGSTVAIYTQQNNSVENAPADLSTQEIGTVAKELPPIAKKYLQSGSQTKITPKIKEIAATITGADDPEIAENIIQWIKSNLKNKDVDSVAKGTLTAEEIIEKGEFSGCTDFALVFITLARAKNIPTIYVETIEKDFLEKVKSGEKIEGSFIGHVFADIYINGEWVAVDPVGGYFTSVDSACLNNKKFDGLNGCYLRKDQGQQIPYLIYDKGTDFWDLGFKNKKEFTDKVYTENKALVGSAISYVYSETLTGKATSVENVKVPETLNGKFTFIGIILEKNLINSLKIESVDSSGNKAVWTGQVFSDADKPQIKLEKLPELSAQNSLQIKGEISENSSYEIFVNDVSRVKKDGTTVIDEQVTLEEGSNKIKISAIDNAGWESSEEFEIIADTKAPTVQFTISKGNEFYQGRAVSDINGETEPGAKVYLYVYRPIGYEFQPDFKKAWKKVTADQNGSFTFNDVNFESTPISLEDLMPKEVPSGLQNQIIYPIQAMADQQQFTYYVYLIAEDASGKNGYGQETVTLRTCYSADWDFDVISLAQFQLPLSINPNLLDDGRETITATFNLSYRGSGVPGYDYATGQTLSGQEPMIISSVTFEKACTPGMMKDPSTKLGCNIFPNSVSSIANGDKTTHFLQMQLHSAEKMSEKKDDFWNEFKKRQIVFPMKIRINYQERQPDGTYTSKTQSSCYDLSYFIDIPLDSKEMIPDWLADEGLTTINWTINKINQIMPYLEKAILVAGVSCMAAFLGKMVIHYVRIVASKLEPLKSKVSGKDDDKKCPSSADQKKLYLERTIDKWTEEEKLFKPENQPKNVKIGKDEKDWHDKTYSFDALCPSTAKIWKAEAVLDQTYRWTCDRYLCRTVPAKWTSEFEEDDINAKIVEQQQCVDSGICQPLVPRENCQDIIHQDLTYHPTPTLEVEMKDGAFTCYQFNGQLYHIVGVDEVSDQRVTKLERINLQFSPTYAEVQSQMVTSDILFAFQPEGSGQLCAAQDKSCKYLCKTKAGYKADTEKGNEDGCYWEYTGEMDKIILKDKSGNLLGGNRYDAGYSNDCFVETEVDTTVLDLVPVGRGPEGSTGMLRCVCAVDDRTKKTVIGSSARTAAKQEGETAETWSYQQETVFTESHGQAGTYYSKLRYYKGRDLSGAFGADYLLDYLRPKGEKKVHAINPSTNTISTLQSVCLVGIRARLVMLQSILQGLASCIQEAKYTGFQDAGVCKTLFAQHVCGLIYKAIALLSKGCNPRGFNDAGEQKESGTLGKVGEVFKVGIGSISEAMDDSIKEIKSDYGNAQLNQFFASGSQGFAQSICMAAFGYDFPIGLDFIMDAAYAYPMESSVIVVPAERELSMFNPSKGTAVYNYNVGALVLPGCRIKTADIYLKCIGPEDMGHKGVSCGKQGCDCLYSQEYSTVPGEKVKYLEKGRIFDLRQGSMVDLKIPSPQKSDSFYRYDHVVVKLTLDPTEKGNEEKCFDEGYRDGTFYFPITDVSPPGEFVCQVQPETGKYFCPEVLAMFGAGSGVYLEEPFLSCYDADGQSWINCETPGLFTKGEEIRVRAHVMTDGKQQYCLKTTISGLQTQAQTAPWIRPIPTLMPGLWTPEFNLGKVGPEMFGAANTLRLTQDSDYDCSQPNPISGLEAQMSSSAPYAFHYVKLDNGNYQVDVPTGVYVEGYSVNNMNQLTLGPDQLRKAIFNFNGLKANNLIGSPLGMGKGFCYYQVGPAAGQGYVQPMKSVRVKVELFQPDVNGYCGDMMQIPVKAPVYGKNSVEKNIPLQLESYISQAATRMHKNLLAGKCNEVLNEANQVINRQASTLEDAVAFYYAVACHIINGKDSWVKASGGQVCHLLNLFFSRQSSDEPFPETVTGTGEFKKINKYFEEIKTKAGCTGIDSGISTAGTSSPVSSAVGKPCGIENTKADFEKYKPENWKQYTCRKQKPEEITSANDLGKTSDVPQCWSQGMYADEAEIAKNELSDCMFCCPPSNAATTTAVATAENQCDPNLYKYDLGGSNAKWLFGCFNATHGISCEKSTGNPVHGQNNPFLIGPGETALLNYCKSS